MECRQFPITEIARAAMPRLPMPPTDEAALAKNKNEQYAALGRFVEAFELMVHEVREICIERICAGIGSGQRESLIEIAFHNQAMSAKPLFDVMRAILAEIVNDPTNIHHADRTLFKGILGRISGEYSHLFNKRNELIHGTWLVGYTGIDDPNASEFFVQKYKTNADGLVPVADLPRTASQLLELASACDAVRDWLSYVDSSFRDNIKITDFFDKRGDEWTLIVYENAKTLPKR
jgi:hypothetical protein